MGDKRVEIAKDVLQQLEIERLIAGGLYLNPGNYFIETERICEMVREAKQCTVCVKGALFASKVLNDSNFNPQYTGADMGKIDSWLSQNLPEFSQNQLDKMESFFEGWSRHLEDNSEVQLCFDFLRKNPTRKDRMIKIMQNVIENQGNFVPEKL